MQVNDELIEAHIRVSEGDIFVREQEEETRAARWIINRIARLPLLADRILEVVPETKHFVTPSGRLLDHLDNSKSLADVKTDDAAMATMEVLARSPAGATSVLY